MGEKTLEVNKAYVLMSSLTGHMYISPDRKAYVFYRQKDGENFIDEWQNGMREHLQKFEKPLLDEPRYYMMDDLLGNCCAAGGQTLVIRANEKAEEFPVIPARLPKRYYNQDLTWILSMLKTTRKESWLKKLMGHTMIVPVQIEENGTGIYYAIARSRESDEYLYLAFTDLTEYSLWASKTEGWSPLEVEYQTVWDVAHKRGLILNVQGNRFVIDTSMAQKLPRPATAEEGDP